MVNLRTGTKNKPLCIKGGDNHKPLIVKPSHVSTLSPIKSMVDGRAADRDTIADKTMAYLSAGGKVDQVVNNDYMVRNFKELDK